MEEKKEELKEFKFELGELKSCPHHFVRMGLNVECTKCGLGFFDPEMNFPLEEANKTFPVLTLNASVNKVRSNRDNKEDSVDS